MAKCLMLDVDGVLVDGRPEDGLRWDTDLKRDLGISPKDLADEFFRDAWDDVVLGRKALLPALAAALRRLTPSVAADELITYWFEMDSRIVEAVFRDAQQARLMGIPVYLATNQEHMRASYLMHAMRLRDAVDGILYSAKLGYKKPQAEFYALAERETGYRSHEMLLVDDTLANVTAAQTAGWSAIHWDGTVSLAELVQGRI